MSTWNTVMAVALSAPGMFMAGWSAGRERLRKEWKR